MGVQIPQWEGAILQDSGGHCKVQGHCGHLQSENSWTNWDAVWTVGLVWLNESRFRWGPDPPQEGAILGKKGHPLSIGTFCRELCRNDWTDRFAICVVDSGWPKEAQVQSYSLGGANVPTWEGTLAPPGEYDWTVRLWQRCGLMSYYFDHLFMQWYTAEVKSTNSTPCVCCKYMPGWWLIVIWVLQCMACILVKNMHRLNGHISLTSGLVSWPFIPTEAGCCSWH